jgi:hypothetical protein
MVHQPNKMTFRQTHFSDHNSAVLPPYSLSKHEFEKEEDQSSWSGDWEPEELLAPHESISTLFMILLTSSMGG